MSTARGCSRGLDVRVVRCSSSSWEAALREMVLDGLSAQERLQCAARRLIPLTAPHHTAPHGHAAAPSCRASDPMRDGARRPIVIAPAALSAASSCPLTDPRPPLHRAGAGRRCESSA
eukprot:2651919-Prymnesium_polylepis.1